MNSTIPLMAVALGLVYSMMAKKGLTREQLEMIDSRMILENVIKLRENDGKPKIESFIDAPAQLASFSAFLPDIPAGVLKIPNTFSEMSLQKPAVEKKDIKLLNVGESKKEIPQPTSVPLADIPSDSLDDGTEAAVNISNIETQDLLKTLSSTDLPSDLLDDGAESPPPPPPPSLPFFSRKFGNMGLTGAFNR